MAGTYPGGFVTKSPTATVGGTDTGFGPEGGSASGMWTLNQALALKSAGNWPSKTKEKYLWAWGHNGNGRLGDNTVVYKSSPVQIGNYVAWSQGASVGQAAFSIKTNGTLWVWGSGADGRQGNDGYLQSEVNRSSPVQIGALTTWSKIVGGHRHVLALKTDGTMWGWGRNQGGAVGDNAANAHRSSPVQIGALTTWSLIASGNYHNLVIKTDGLMWVWGQNDQGQLGDNTQINKSSPVQLGTDYWSQVAGGDDYALAIKTNGTLWAWGKNQFGQLGDNTVSINKSSPIQVGALTTWSKVEAGNGHTIALKTDGTMWLWGYNAYGSIGDNTRTLRSSPVQIGTDYWSQIDAPGGHVMAIKPDGTLWAWGGSNSSGKLGDNTTINRSSPVQVGSLTTWSKIFTGGPTANFSMAIKTDSSLYAWGDNGSGQLGQNTQYNPNASNPTQVGYDSIIDSSWTSIDGGHDHSMALKANGTLWTWGYNGVGQLGNNTRLNHKSSPIQIGALTTWSIIAGSDYHSMAIKTDGTLWLWGSPGYGALGNGPVIYRSSPVQIGALTTWSKISGGNYISMAIKTDGTLWGWGRNSFGFLGDNTVVAKSSPVQIGALTTWSKIDVTSFGMAIKTDGTMWGWGQNNVGQIGDGTTTHRSSPVQIGALTTWSKIALGIDHGMAVKTEGTLWAWGKNQQGQLGDNTIINISSPVQIGALTTWSLISAGQYLSAAIKTDGTMWTWGNNGYGQLGDGPVISRSSPVQVGATVIGWSLAATSSSSAATLAIKADGTMWTWGYNANGQLGLNTFGYSKSSPVQIGTLTSWSKIANGGSHAMALKTDGTMWAWGNHGSGQLGDNTNIDRSSPIQIGALTTWSLIAAGAYHSIALKTNGTMWAWGRNNIAGPLGDNTIITKSSPVQVGALTTWSQIAAGQSHSIAIKTDGTLWAFGYNTKGQLGDNTVINRSSPVQVGALTTWSKIASGARFSAAIKTDGTLWTFGYSTYTGQLGDNTVINRSSPVQVGALTTWSKIALGGEHAMALKTDGTLWLWGNNGYGVLGDNTRVYRSSPVQVGSLTTWSSIACTGGTNSIAIDINNAWYSWGSNSNGSVGDNTVIKRSSPVQIGSEPAAETNHWSKIAAGNFYTMLAISAE